MMSPPFGTATSIENAVPVWRWQFSYSLCPGTKATDVPDQINVGNV
jgi:hypothetical protein